MQIFALRYFLNAQVVGNDLWLLLGQSETSEAVIRVIRANGSLGERELVVQPLDPRLGKVKDISAAALMEDGAPVLGLGSPGGRRIPMGLMLLASTVV